ncbi:MAG TPA: sigma-70 family RNA polymerase sigma factor [Mycobacteriales bacterium]|nr:sigma-70 family RNA polymerase sigma factor [Mycobacteriales bacterium]
MTASDAYEDAFATLYALAYRVAYRILGVRAEAEDVAAETMARACDRWDRLRDDPQPWVVTVAARQALDVARGWARRRRLAPPPAPTTVPDPHVEERVDLQRVLRKLPRRQREVVALRYLADLSEADTAAALGISAGAVKTHASRGLAALRTVLSDPAAVGEVRG